LAERAGDAAEPRHGLVDGGPAARGHSPPPGRLEANAGPASGLSFPRLGPYGAGRAGRSRCTPPEVPGRRAGPPPGAPDARGRAFGPRAFRGRHSPVPAALRAGAAESARMVRARAEL